MTAVLEAFGRLPSDDQTPVSTQRRTTIIRSCIRRRGTECGQPRLQLAVEEGAEAPRPYPPESPWAALGERSPLTHPGSQRPACHEPHASPFPPCSLSPCRPSRRIASSSGRLRAPNAPVRPNSRLHRASLRNRAGHAVGRSRPGVFAYHTDRAGVYDRSGAPAPSWRSHGLGKDRGRWTVRVPDHPSRAIPSRARSGPHAPDALHGRRRALSRRWGALRRCSTRERGRS